MRANYKERKWRTTMKMRWHWRVGKNKRTRGSAAHTPTVYHSIISQDESKGRKREWIILFFIIIIFPLFSLRLLSLLCSRLVRLSTESVCRSCSCPPTTINYRQDSSVFFFPLIVVVRLVSALRFGRHHQRGDSLAALSAWLFFSLRYGLDLTHTHIPVCIVVVLFGLSGLVDNCLRETVAGSPASVKCMWMDGRGPRILDSFVSLTNNNRG